MPTTSERTAKLGDRTLGRVVFDRDEIAERVGEMGREITRFYDDDDGLLVLGLLKGSFVFLADLVRAVDRPLHVDFLLAQSYGDRKVTTGEVELLYDPEAELRGRRVLLVEDIVDTGTTLERVLPMLEAREPASLDVCALLHKRHTELPTPPRWVGFEAPDEFLVGYGLDYSEDFRHLPYIASL